ncbi:helix-turn-helix transcriptional regulator [Cohnella boryungensis]|uniref:Helix-turn-helix transcriptional regulator n=1 Tax=Cohnella boryungensis TaxID=768479 RepID=A0ABV8S8K6_9BACL
MKIDRLLSIVMLLLESDRVSTSKLAKMFEVSTRTIFRDIEVINKAGIPIVSYPGNHGGIGIMENYKIKKKLFTSSDINTLLIGLNSIQSSMSSDEIHQTITKIKGMLSEEDVRDFDNQVIVDNSPWYGLKYPKPNFDEMNSAIKERRLLSFKYADQNGMRTERVIEPYRLIMKDTNWYLQGFCTTKEAFRTFRLTRISFLRVLDKHFIPREFKSALEAKSERETITIKLLVNESLLDIMTEYCGKDCIKAYDSKHWMVDFPFIEDDHGYGFLLRFGEKCICVEPEHVRIEVIRRIKYLQAAYQIE